MVWDAAHSSGLIIEPFAVPPDMAAKGLTGQVVASQMLDKLTAMQDATDSTRPPQSYANNWGNNIKVEIPETGVSIGELQQLPARTGWAMTPTSPARSGAPPPASRSPRATAARPAPPSPAPKAISTG